MLQTWQIRVTTLTKKDRLRRRQSLSNIGYKIDILHVQTAPNDKDIWSNIQLIWKLCLNFLMVNWAHIKLLKYSYSLNTQISISISPSWNFIIYNICYVGIKLSKEKKWAIGQSLERWQHNPSIQYNNHIFWMNSISLRLVLWFIIPMFVTG